MNTGIVSNAQERAKVGISEIAERIRDFSENAKESCKDAYRDAERTARKMKIAAQDKFDEARQQIKSRPIAAIVVVASGALLTGVIIGLLCARSARR